MRHRGVVALVIRPAGTAKERRGMPLYEFMCADCKARFEVLTSYEASESGTPVCATCHGTRVRKLVPLVAKRSRGGDDFGDFGDGSDFGDGGDMGGSCGCGGACSCGN
jgi:putative FmdB family regulatory protein